jgi:hypothetical protein
VSTTTTRSRVLRSAGLVFAPLLLLGLSACGDDDDGGGGDSAGGSTGGSTEGFCNDIEAISADGDEFAANSDSADLETLRDQITDIVERMQALDPPAAIEDDWNQAVDAMVDLTNGSGQPTEEQTQAGDRVAEYLRNECGLSEDSFLGSSG